MHQVPGGDKPRRYTGSLLMRAVPVGQGFIDFESFFKGLRDGGYEGPVAYEMCSPLRGGGSEDNLDRTAGISLNRIRALINRSASP